MRGGGGAHTVEKSTQKSRKSYKKLLVIFGLKLLKGVLTFSVFVLQDAEGKRNNPGRDGQN